MFEVRTPISSPYSPKLSSKVLSNLESQTSNIESWWAMTGSNRRHPACKAGALPAELITRGLTLISIHKNVHCVKAFFCFFTYEFLSNNI